MRQHCSLNLKSDVAWNVVLSEMQGDEPLRVVRIPQPDRPLLAESRIFVSVSNADLLGRLSEWKAVQGDLKERCIRSSRRFQRFGRQRSACSLDVNRRLLTDNCRSIPASKANLVDSLRELEVV